MPCTKPIASFSYTQTGNKDFTFRDTSTVTNPAHCGIATWAWSFPSGTPSVGNAQNPPGVHYGSANSHTVTLTVTNSAGSATYSHNQ